MSITTGVLIGLFAWTVDLQFPVEWAVIAFTLNYIPFIGSFVATLLPTLFEMAQANSGQSIVGIFVCLNIIQFVIGSYIELDLPVPYFRSRHFWSCSRRFSGPTCGDCMVPSSACPSLLSR